MSSTVGEWHFAALTFSRNLSTATAFMDGQAASVRTPGNVSIRSSPVFVGASSSNLLNAFYGNIHDVRVYNKALTRRELRMVWAQMSHKLQVWCLWYFLLARSTIASCSSNHTTTCMIIILCE